MCNRCLPDSLNLRRAPADLDECANAPPKLVTKPNASKRTPAAVVPAMET